MSEQSVHPQAEREAALALRVRELETQLQQLCQSVLRLEGLLESRSKLFADLVHELRSPLGVLSGYARLLLKEQAGTLNPVQLEYLAIIQSNAAAMTDAVNEASHSAQTLEGRCNSFDLRELWTELVDLMSVRAARNAATLCLRLPSERCLVFGDHDELELVFHRLLASAFDSLPFGGRIEVELASREGTLTTIISGSQPPAHLSARARAGLLTDCPLGLSSSMSQKLRAHGGEFSSAGGFDGSWRFSIVLPRTSAHSGPGGT